MNAFNLLYLYIILDQATFRLVGHRIKLIKANLSRNPVEDGKNWLKFVNIKRFYLKLVLRAYLFECEISNLF